MEGGGAIGGLSRDFNYTYNVASDATAIWRPLTSVAKPVTSSAKILGGLKALEKVTSITVHTAQVAGNVINGLETARQAGRAVETNNRAGNLASGGEIRKWTPSFTQRWSMNQNWIPRFAYEAADALWVTTQNILLKPFQKDVVRHIGGEPSNPAENVNAFVGAAQFIIPTAEVEEVAAETAAKEGANVTEEVAIHGNSLKSLKPTWGYKLYSNDGTFLKNGITSKVIPETRYTKSFMFDKYMGEKVLFPNRAAAYQWEFQQNQILRGPLNLNMH